MKRWRANTFELNLTLRKGRTVYLVTKMRTLRPCGSGRVFSPCVLSLEGISSATTQDGIIRCLVDYV